VSGSGISWAICKSAPRSRQITTLNDKWASGSKFSLVTTTLAGVSKFCIKSGHLVHRQITKFFATGCQILRLKCTKFDFGWGSARDLNGGSYSLQERCLTSAAGTRGRATGCGLVRSSSCAGNQRVRNYNRIQNLLICEQPMKAILLGLRICRCGQMTLWAGFHYNLFYIVLRNGPKVSELFSYSLTEM